MSAGSSHNPAPSDACASCAAPLAQDQRYCLECGARRGPARLDPVAQAPLRRPGVAQAPEARGPAVPAWAALHPAVLALGRPRVAAVAAGVLLFTGALFGAAILPGAPQAAPSGMIIARVLAPASEDPAPGDTSDAAPADDGTATEEPAADPPATDVTESPPPVTKPKPKPKPKPPVDPGPTSPAPVKHVWVIALEGMNVATDPVPSAALRTAAASAAADPQPTGLAALRAAGTTLTGYTSTGKGSLANAVTLVSGQRATPAQEAGCPTYTEVSPGTPDEQTGLMTGDGCVAPPEVVTITDRFTGEGLVWKAYAEDVGAGSPGGATCRHPDLGAADPFFAPRPGDAYLTWRVPFLYFRSITESPDCGTSVVGLDHVAPDLEQAENTPAFSYIVPNACHDGSATPCAPDAPAGIAAAEAWLTPVVAQIQASPAYEDGGLIVIISTDGSRLDPAAPPVVPTGAILLSPYVAAGATIARPYDHLSLLKTLSRIFGIDPLAHAADATVTSFGPKVFAKAPAPDAG